VTVAAKRIHSKAKGEKVHLDLIVPVRRGLLIHLNEATVDLVVR